MLKENIVRKFQIRNERTAQALSLCEEACPLQWDITPDKEKMIKNKSYFLWPRLYVFYYFCRIVAYIPWTDVTTLTEESCQQPAYDNV